MQAKGKVAFFDGCNRLLKEDVYRDKRGQKILINLWLKQYGHIPGVYYQITPYPSMKLTPEQQEYFTVMFNNQNKKQPPPERHRIGDRYTNLRSPFGIADELHKRKK